MLLRFSKMRSRPNGLTIELRGGLGNQLFQFANALNLSLTYGRAIRFVMKDNYRNFELKSLGIKEANPYRVLIQGQNLNLVHSIESKFPVAQVAYEESSFRFRKLELDQKVNVITGYYQSPKYFEKYKVEISNFLRQNFKIESNEESNGEVVVHVRLGDMAQNLQTNSFHGIVSEKYLLKAIKKLNYRSVLVVTESPELLKDLYPQFFQVIDKVVSQSNIQDFQLIAGASRIVISNSTFSWWAAFLSNAEVVAPRNWFTPQIMKVNPIDDLIPQEWHLL